MGGWTKLVSWIEGQMDDPDLKVDMYGTATKLGLISPRTADADSRGGFWSINPENWYKVFPYQFVVMQAAANDSGIPEVSTNTSPTEFSLYTLPIPPQALTVKMVPASQVTATMGGVVEETAANVFWDIVLAGTTGTAVGKSGSLESRMNPGNGVRTATVFRDKISTTGELSGILGGLGASAAKIGQQADRVAGAIENPSWAGVIGSVSGAIQDALLPTPLYTASAVSRKRNGYSEMLEMQRFLLVYSRMKGAFPNKYFLKFRMYKTGQEWMCSIRDFQVSQSMNNPMLYKYNIQLRCWNVGGIAKDKQNEASYDRFGPTGDLKAVNILSTKQASKGLSGLFGKKKKK